MRAILVLPGYLPVAAAYVGPGDVVASATGWWGLRAYSSAKVGSNAVRLRRDSDNAEQDFVTVAGGGLDITSINTFAGAANLFVTKLYDQAGTNDAVQATAGFQPSFLLSPFPTVTDLVNDGFLVSASTVTKSEPWTFSFFAKRTGNLAAFTFVVSVGGSPGVGYSPSGAGALLATTFNNSASAVDTVFNAIHGVFNGTAGDLNVNGVPSTPVIDGGVSISAQAITLMGAGSQNGILIGSATEFGFWGFAFTPTQSSNMSSNQHGYWGV